MTSVKKENGSAEQISPTQQLAQVEIIDTRGLVCPLPILELAKRLRVPPIPGVLELWSTDPAMPADLEAFCRGLGHHLLHCDRVEGIYRARIGLRFGRADPM